MGRCPEFDLMSRLTKKSSFSSGVPPTPVLVELLLGTVGVAIVLAGTNGGSFEEDEEEEVVEEEEEGRGLLETRDCFAPRPCL